MDNVKFEEQRYYGNSTDVKETKMIVINPKDEVKKSEIIVRSRYNLNPLALKFITIIISNIKPSDEPNVRYTFKIKDFAEITGKEYGELYNELSDAVKELLSNPLHINLDDGWLKVNWISSARYEEGEGTISFRIDSDLFPILLEVKEKFLKYRLENILKLNSKYSIRLYEMLKDWYELNKRYNRKAEKIIDLEWFRTTLNIPESYKFHKIKTRILEKSKKELSQNTDIRFDYEEIKTGRKVTHLKFIISSTENQDKENQDIAIGEKKEKLTPKDIREELKDKILTIENDYYYINQNLLFKNGELLNKEEALLEYSYIGNNWNKAKIVTQEEFEKLNKQKVAKELLETYKNKVLKLFPIGDDYKNLEILDIYDFESLDDFKVIAKDEEGKYYKFKSSLNTLKVYTT